MVFSAQGRDEKMSMRIGTVVRGREASASFVSAPSSAMALKGKEKDKTHLGSAAEVLISRKARLLQLGERDAKEILRDAEERDDMSARGRIESVEDTRDVVKAEKERVVAIKELLKDDTLTDDEKKVLKEEKEKLLSHIVATSYDDKISMIYDLKTKLEKKMAEARAEVEEDRLRAPLPQEKDEDEDFDWQHATADEWNKRWEKELEKANEWLKKKGERIENPFGLRDREQRDFDELDASFSKLNIWLKGTQALAEDLEWTLLKFAEYGRQEDSDEATETMKEEQKKLEEIAKMKEGLLPLPPEKKQKEDADADDDDGKDKGKIAGTAAPTASPAARAAVRIAMARYAAKH